MLLSELISRLEGFHESNGEHEVFVEWGKCDTDNYGLEFYLLNAPSYNEEEGIKHPALPRLEIQ